MSQLFNVKLLAVSAKMNFTFINISLARLQEPGVAQSDTELEDRHNSNVEDIEDTAV